MNDAITEALSWVGELAVMVAAAILVAAVFAIVKAHRATAPESAPEPSDWLDRVCGERVLVHTVDDRSIDGVLVEVFPSGLLLRAPRLLDDQPIDMHGELFIPGDKIGLVQRGGDK